MNKWFSAKARKGILETKYGVYIHPIYGTGINFRENGEEIHLTVSYMKFIVPISEKELLCDPETVEELEPYYQQAFTDSFDKHLKNKAVEIQAEKEAIAKREAYNKMSPEQQEEHDKVDNFNKLVDSLKGKPKSVIIETLAKEGYNYKFTKANYPCDHSYFESVWIKLRQLSIAKD